MTQMDTDGKTGTGDAGRKRFLCALLTLGLVPRLRDVFVRGMVFKRLCSMSLSGWTVHNVQVV